MRFAKLLMILAVVALVSTICMADITLGTEDPVSGYVAQLPFGGTTTAWIASDGEAAFDPWGFGGDTSDGLALNAGWVQSTGSSWIFCANCSNAPVDANGAPLNVWIMPACVNGICENGPVPESIGLWNFPGNYWNFSGTFSYVILDPEGNWSDSLVIGNFGPDGTAGMEFISDGAVPEPSSIVLFGSGLLAAAGTIRRKLNL